jgi:hypothetical protein
MAPEERAAILRYIIDHPEESYIKIGLRFGKHGGSIQRYAAEAGITRPAGVKRPKPLAMAVAIPTEEEVR